MTDTIQELLDRASDCYYKGKPIMSDEQFDILSAHFDYGSIGHKVTGGIPHYHPMYSLKKCFDLSEAPIDLALCVKTPKLDGAAISILYVGGELILSLTRGDGKIGKDITEKVKLLVPNYIDFSKTIQVNGEVLAPKHIPNSRNYAAGALNLKSLEEFKEKELIFVAYDLVKNPLSTWTKAMNFLSLKYGFVTVTDFDPAGYPTDGEVFRVDNQSKFDALGYTSSHPRGAFALKERKEGVVTKLLDVVWQVGKSGIVSPVAILEPVYIDGAKISKATLHNIEYIRGLDLEIGCQVEVIRSGDIIPRIVRKV